MSKKLFTELTVEQQETANGGTTATGTAMFSDPIGILPALIKPLNGIGGTLVFPPGFLPGFPPGFPPGDNTFVWKVV